jgi:SAM-dependent methyltransferase
VTVFGNYAQYYDLLYRDKEYTKEAQFIHSLIQTHAPGSKNILELGCGTGNHAMLLAQIGYNVHGVDLSMEMLERAHERVFQCSQGLGDQLKFTAGDIREVRLNQKFEVVISLFHVISYQTTNKDLLAAFTTAKTHLQAGGIFIFDVWYGPAVLRETPQVRVKHLENELIEVTRIAEPLIHPNENYVDVNYHVFVKDKQTAAVEELRETHRMRYLFKPEVELLLDQLQMELVDHKEWLTNREASLDTWGTYFVGNNPIT